MAATAIGALSSGDYQTFASLMDPVALADFRKMMIEVIDAVQALPEDDPSAAELEDFLGADLAKLRSLDGRAFFLQFLRGAMASVPALSEAMAGADIEIVGHVLENDDLAHVVFRYSLTVEEVTTTQMAVESLRRTQDGRRMLLRADIQALGQAIRQQLLE